MNSNPQRVAWSVLSAAFAAFCVLVVALPFGVRWFVLNTTTLQNATISLTSGTVLLTRPGAALPEAIGASVDNLPEGVQVETGTNAQATITFAAPDSAQPLGALQIYGDSEAVLQAHRSPRFRSSTRAHAIRMTLQRGRMRVTLAVDVERPVAITLTTPHAVITLDRAGSYAVEVGPQDTQVSVRDGAASITAAGQTLILAPDERTVVQAGGAPLGVLPSERNLVQNGDFEAPLSQGWTTYQNRQEAGESAGSLELVVHDGRRALHFNRRGANWAEVGIEQLINRDVRDVETLQLHLAVWLAFQDLRNCGSLGSECPLMVRVEYTDTAGNGREWLQGFYYLVADAEGTPVRCVTCPPPTGDHAQITNGVWFLYDSPELTELFGSTGNPLATVNSISIYSSGHSFESYVAEVELLAQD